MKSFGNRTAAPTTASRSPSAPTSASAAAFGLLGALAATSALAALHVWFNLLHVPLVRPIGALFGGAPVSREGWAAWYLPALAAAILSVLLMRLYFRRSHRWTIVGLSVAGMVAVIFGAWAALWVKNIGYTWYFVPGASVMAILGVQPQMAAVAFGRAMTLLTTQVPLLLLAGLAVGGLFGLAAGLPLRANQPQPGHAPVADAALVTDTTRTLPQAGWFGRIGTSVLMALMGGGATYFGQPGVGLLMMMPVVGLIWFFVSFRDGRYSFGNVVLGSAAIAFLSVLPLTIGMMHPALRAGPSVLAIGMATRFPLFLLLSVGIIKLVMARSRKQTQSPHVGRSEQL